jgi:hypothetical protein
MRQSQAMAAANPANLGLGAERLHGAQPAGEPEIVSINKADPVAAGDAEAMVARAGWPGIGAWPTQNDPLIASRQFGESVQGGRLGAAVIDQDELALQAGGIDLRQRRGNRCPQQAGFSIHHWAYHADVHA